jgi:hypothetical protein
MTIIARFLGWLLWHANAVMGSSVDRFAAYAIKERILRRHGSLVGEDIQHIKRECYGCRGSGYYYAGEECYRCGGTGVYDEKWIRLERWELGGHIFHRPIGNMARPMNGMVTVEGRIYHDDRNHAASSDALLWLALVFDRRFFWRQFSRSRGYHELWRPMLGLQALVFEIRPRSWFRQHVAARRNCMNCHRDFWRLFNRGSHHTCPACAERSRLKLAYIDDDLPF